MSFDKKKIDTLASIIETLHGNYAGQLLPEESLALIENLTIGDLIIEFGLSVDEAASVLKNADIIRRKVLAPGFRTGISESKTLSKIRQIIYECACEEMEQQAPTQYHPVSSGDGLSFEDSDPHEEAGMIKSNLFSISSKAQQLHDMVGDSDDLPEWVQEKIAVVDEMIDVITDYLTYEYGRSGAMSEANTKKKKYAGKQYTASKGSLDALKKSGGSTKRAVKSGAFDWADEPYAAAQAAHIVATGEPTTKKSSKK